MNENPFMPQQRPQEDAREALRVKASKLLDYFGYHWALVAVEGKLKELTDEQCRLILAELRL